MGTSMYFHTKRPTKVEVWRTLCLEKGVMTGRECPQCRQVNFVRVERVFKGGMAITELSCVSCTHTWVETDGDGSDATEGRDE